MKEWYIRLVLVAVLLALVGWGWYVLFPSPEKVIKKRLGQLAKATSFSSKEGLVAKAWNANLLGDFFTADVEVTVGIPGAQHTINGRGELMQNAVGVRSQFSSLTVEFPDIKVIVAPDQTSAEVFVTARARVPGERDYFLQELRMRVVKVKRDWLINQVETVKTLSLDRPERQHLVLACRSSR
ncbi:MAG: hypothetical protein NT154_27085 [Verrucomicrobia bacterium]|nr:hypothetical protein [Verrucomicrobiota bacterium]